MLFLSGNLAVAYLVCRTLQKQLTSLNKPLLGLKYFCMYAACEVKQTTAKGVIADAMNIEALINLLIFPAGRSLRVSDFMQQQLPITIILHFTDVQELSRKCKRGTLNTACTGLEIIQ